MKEMDVVILKDGRQATILEDFGSAFLSEITDRDGKTLEMPLINTEDVEKIIYTA